jgi:hypothetical protein
LFFLGFGVGYGFGLVMVLFWSWLRSLISVTVTVSVMSEKDGFEIWFQVSVVMALPGQETFFGFSCTLSGGLYGHRSKIGQHQPDV